MRTTPTRPAPNVDQAAMHCYAACRPDVTVPEGPGVAGATVELLTDGPVAVLASPLPSGVERGDRESLEAHARVVQQAFEAGVVLPLRFPTVAPSRGEVVTELLRPLRRSILRSLGRLDGREEVRLRVTYEEDAAVAEIVTAVPRIARLRGRSDAALQLGEAIVSELRHRARRDAEAVLKALRPVAADVKLDALGTERDVLVASVLVPRGGTGRVTQTLEQWAQERPAVRVRVSGPLPAYSFAEIDGV
jgi:Gas vesicle synthesis protein GvpL/GvpF